MESVSYLILFFLLNAESDKFFAEFGYDVFDQTLFYSKEEGSEAISIDVGASYKDISLFVSHESSPFKSDIDDGIDSIGLRYTLSGNIGFADIYLRPAYNKLIDDFEATIMPADIPAEVNSFTTMEVGLRFKNNVGIHFKQQNYDSNLNLETLTSIGFSYIYK